MLILGCVCLPQKKIHDPKQLALLDHSSGMIEREATLN